MRLDTRMFITFFKFRLLSGLLLLLAGLFSLQQSTHIAYAASVAPSFDLVLYTTVNTVWGHNGFPGTELDDDNIGVINNSGLTSDSFGGSLFVLARGTDIYEERGHFLFQLLWSPGSCVTATGWCLVELDDNPDTTVMAAGGNGLFYQAHRDGTVWQLNGICFHCWTQIANPNMALGSITAGDGKLAVSNGVTTWKYNGTPFAWTTIDQPALGVSELVASPGGVFYEGRVGNPPAFVQGLSAFHWVTIYQNANAGTIFAGRRTYLETVNPSTFKESGLFIYNENVSNPIWTALPSLPSSTLPSSILESIEPGTMSDALYIVLSDDSVWQYTPESGIWQEFSPPVAPQGVQVAFPGN